MDSLYKPLRLVIKSPNFRISDQTVEYSLNWTVKKLKIYLSIVYPTKPNPKNQKLIYSGRLLHDDLTLGDVFHRIDQNQPPVLHLVCSASRENIPPREGTSFSKGNSAYTGITNRLHAIMCAMLRNSNTMFAARHSMFNDKMTYMQRAGGSARQMSFPHIFGICLLLFLSILGAIISGWNILVKPTIKFMQVATDNNALYADQHSFESILLMVGHVVMCGMFSYCCYLSIVDVTDSKPSAPQTPTINEKLRLNLQDGPSKFGHEQTRLNTGSCSKYSDEQMEYNDDLQDPYDDSFGLKQHDTDEETMPPDGENAFSDYDDDDQHDTKSVHSEESE